MEINEDGWGDCVRKKKKYLSCECYHLQSCKGRVCVAPTLRGIIQGRILTSSCWKVQSLFGKCFFQCLCSLMKRSIPEWLWTDFSINYSALRAPRVVRYISLVWRVKDFFLLFLSFISPHRVDQSVQLHCSLSSSLVVLFSNSRQAAIWHSISNVPQMRNKLLH